MGKRGTQSVGPPGSDGESGDGTGSGIAGASARRAYERRRDARERRVRERFPRIGGLILALQGTPAHERVWADGAAGEQRVAGELTRRCGDAVRFLHDRAIPGSRANIDHVAIAPSGVWVIDAKRYKGKLRVEKRLFGAAKLRIAGRDRTKLIDGLDWQVGLVRDAVDRIDAAVPVRGALCFVETELPWLGTPTFREHALVSPRRLAKQLKKAGPVLPEVQALLARELAEAFPSA